MEPHKSCWILIFNKYRFFLEFLKLIKYRRKSINLNMKPSQRLLFIRILLCMIPVNIYIIGKDMIGAGIQFPFFRFQISYLGDSLVSIAQEISYVVQGVITGISRLSLLLWILGSFFLFLSVFFPLLKSQFIRKYDRNSGILILLSGILFLTSIFTQYGLYLYGPAGTAIPIGLPVLFVIGGWMYMDRAKGGGRGRG